MCNLAGIARAISIASGLLIAAIVLLFFAAATAGSVIGAVFVNPGVMATVATLIAAALASVIAAGVLAASGACAAGSCGGVASALRSALAVAAVSLALFMGSVLASIFLVSTPWLGTWAAFGLIASAFSLSASLGGTAMWVGALASCLATPPSPPASAGSPLTSGPAPRGVITARYMAAAASVMSMVLVIRLVASLVQGQATTG
jgi:hypothetical protein